MDNESAKTKNEEIPQLNNYSQDKLIKNIYKQFK